MTDGDMCDAETMCWQHIENSSTTPPALAAHTLTAAGQHGILCFGGHGKKVYNNIHKLDPTTCLWDQFKTIGVGSNSSVASVSYTDDHAKSVCTLCTAGTFLSASLFA